MPLIASAAVLSKLTAKHGVSLDEVEQCFANRDGKLLEDTREDHRTNPPTQWFIAETNQGRRLKVCAVVDGQRVYLKTAYPPDHEEERIYKKFAY